MPDVMTSMGQNMSHHRNFRKNGGEDSIYCNECKQQWSQH